MNKALDYEVRGGDNGGSETKNEEEQASTNLQFVAQRWITGCYGQQDKTGTIYCKWRPPVTLCQS